MRVHRAQNWSIVGFVAVRAPHPFEFAGVSVQHDHTVVDVSVGNKGPLVVGSTTTFVGWPKLSMSRLLGSLIGRAAPARGRAPSSRSASRICRPSCTQDMGIGSAAASQPHVDPVVDVDAVLLSFHGSVGPGPPCFSRLPSGRTPGPAARSRSKSRCRAVSFPDL